MNSFSGNPRPSEDHPPFSAEPRLRFLTRGIAAVGTGALSNLDSVPEKHQSLKCKQTPLLSPKLMISGV